MAEIKSRSSVFKVTYNGKNITEDISLHLTSLSYTDNVSGMADDLQIRLEDKGGKWCDSWYPEKGAKLLLELGGPDGKLLKPNAFELDEIELDGDKDSGDTVTIKAISGGVTKALHTKRSHAHENKTLSEIVHTIAAKYGLTVIGSIENIVIGRVTNNRQSDLSFLNRLANEYGYSFGVKGSKLSFVKLTTLEAHSKVITIDKSDCISWSIRDKSSQIFAVASVKSHNPNKNKVIKSAYTVEQVANNDGIQFNYLKEAQNSLEVRSKTESEQQAIVKVSAALHFVNSLQQTASVTMIGNVILLAGNNVELTGFGRLSGIWNILKSTHSIDRGQNYRTTVEMKRVIPASQSGSKKKAKETKPSSTYRVTNKANADGINFNYLEVK
jgi:phage protein D